jgi:ferredoxin
MVKLIINGHDVEIEDGELIKDPCEEAGIPFACTEGICGTCVIQVTEGSEHLSEPTEEEKDFLGDDVGEERLACQCRIKCCKLDPNSDQEPVIRISDGFN